MTSDQLVVQVKKVCQFAHLRAVACSEHHGIAALLEFFDNWCEKWHMRRVIQIDPDLPPVGDRSAPAEPRRQIATKGRLRWLLRYRDVRTLVKTFEAGFLHVNAVMRQRTTSRLRCQRFVHRMESEPNNS